MNFKVESLRRSKNVDIFPGGRRDEEGGERGSDRSQAHNLSQYKLSFWRGPP